MDNRATFSLQPLEQRVLLSADGLGSVLDQVVTRGSEVEVFEILEMESKPDAYPGEETLLDADPNFLGQPANDILPDLEGTMDLELPEDQTESSLIEVPERAVALQQVSSLSNQVSQSILDYITGQFEQAIQDQPFTQTQSLGSDLGISGVFQIQNPTLTFNAVFSSSSSSWEGSVSISSAGALLFPGSEIEATLTDAPEGAANHDGLALNATYDISSKSITLTTDVLEMGLGTVAAVPQGLLLCIVPWRTERKPP